MPDDKFGSNIDKANTAFNLFSMVAPVFLQLFQGIWDIIHRDEKKSA